MRFCYCALCRHQFSQLCCTPRLTKQQCPYYLPWFWQQPQFTTKETAEEMWILSRENELDPFLCRILIVWPQTCTFLGLSCLTGKVKWWNMARKFIVKMNVFHVRKCVIDVKTLSFIYNFIGLVFVLFLQASLIRRSLLTSCHTGFKLVIVV